MEGKKYIKNYAGLHWCLLLLDNNIVSMQLNGTARPSSTNDGRRICVAPLSHKRWAVRFVLCNLQLSMKIRGMYAQRKRQICQNGKTVLIALIGPLACTLPGFRHSHRRHRGFKVLSFLFCCAFGSPPSLQEKDRRETGARPTSSSNNITNSQTVTSSSNSITSNDEAATATGIDVSPLETKLVEPEPPHVQHPQQPQQPSPQQQQQQPQPVLKPAIDTTDEMSECKATTTTPTTAPAQVQPIYPIPPFSLIIFSLSLSLSLPISPLPISVTLHLG